MKVTMEAAYAEACLALGESVVRERLLAKQLREQEPEETPCDGCGTPGVFAQGHCVSCGDPNP